MGKFIEIVCKRLQSLQCKICSANVRKCVCPVCAIRVVEVKWLLIRNFRTQTHHLRIDTSCLSFSFRKKEKDL